jgi:hypothetical protein
MNVSESKQILGIVKDASFISAETKNTMTLTTVQMQEATAPDSGILNLLQFEGKAILVSYQHISGDLVWGAEITDTSGPILTLLIKRIFDLG